MPWFTGYHWIHNHGSSRSSSSSRNHNKNAANRQTIIHSNQQSKTPQACRRMTEKSHIVCSPRTCARAGMRECTYVVSHLLWTLDRRTSWLISLAFTSRTYVRCSWCVSDDGFSSSVRWALLLFGIIMYDVCVCVCASASKPKRWKTNTSQQRAPFFWKR